ADGVLRNAGAEAGGSGREGVPRRGNLPAGLPPTSLPRLETKWRPHGAGAEAAPRRSEPGRRRRQRRRAHVIKGVSLLCVSFQNATGIQNESGVWATKSILKGKKFGPFVGDKKKRSQVKSNVYMWEVYYPNLGWMCVDATDPEKGNWLRYINWARSGKEQNLFPLEINRTIYYKSLKPIAPGEELLVWYNGEDDPEIAAAIEEERASARSRRHSPKAKKGKALRGRAAGPRRPPAPPG
uniref:SET domain-containing protein n=1 Tax=Strigops habroptila TaxID=2489341 RepID=A0A672TY81_STRHB